MPYYPGAHVALLPEATTQPPIVPRLAILHTNASPGPVSPAGLRAYMARPDVSLECHFDIGTDGSVWQFMPVNVRADCNAAANPFAVSIETQDNGGATVAVTPWSAAQCTSIADLLRWLHDTCAIPLVRCTRWDGTGVGAHRDFPQWSAAAHSCPGATRLTQVSGLIAAAAQPTTPPTQPPEEPIMWGQFVKDDGPGEFWFEAIDVTGRFWCDTVVNLGYDWTVIDLPSLQTKPLAALMAARTKQKRPSTPTALDIGQLLDELAARLAS